MDDLEGEIWKEHPIGIRVSNLGRVETARKGKHFGHKNGTPYLYVRWGNKMYRVHRLICEAFHPNEDNLPTVDHINRDKTDNRACNLRWADMKMQCDNREIDYKARTANTDWKAIGKKLSIPILQLNKDTMEVVKEWESAHQAEREGGFHNGNINNCLKGKVKTCGGYIWRYAS